MKIPILFVIFNRPAMALKSFQPVKQYKPDKLYIAADGARSNRAGEQELCQQTRDVILQEIDWECDIHTLFQEQNLGCGQGVYTAVNWFFSNEKQGVILEDDCVVSRSFFPYMEELLDRYKNDDRIGMIAGYNDVENEYQIENSYCFSKYAACWGWGSWARAWKNMDLQMSWRKHNEEDCLHNKGYYKEYNRWKYQLKAIDNHYVSAWDWQWYFSLATRNQLSIFPKVRLVSNIGFGKDATHTTSKPKNLSGCQELNFPLIHPCYILPDNTFDKTLYKRGNSLYSVLMRYIPFEIKTLIKKIVR
jgi:hypothetical protein